MQRRILMSMLTIALAAAMVGGATVAVFTAQDRTSNQVGFTAGTVQVEAGEIVVTESVNLSNLAPGDTVSGSFEVSNTGTLEVYYIVEPVATGYLFE